jgi:N4-(beta-N-acetylglucosaminyl)-L-asparaginase
MPVVISTWGFVDAVREAALVLKEGGSAVDAVVYGCSTCERLRCDGSGTTVVLLI